MHKRVKNHILVALSFLGSATLLFSCDTGRGAASAPLDEGKLTEYSENLSIVMSQNGRPSYHFETPLMEGYSQAREPYHEFRKGIKIVTYQDDSMRNENATLTANYAIYYKERQLWEAKGDVVARKADGKTLYTQQLFWNARTRKIYSNVDSKFVDRSDVFMGEGFESDEEFRDWRFRRMKGRMEVDMQRPVADSTTVSPREEKPAVKPAPRAERKAEAVKASDRRSLAEKETVPMDVNEQLSIEL